MKQTAVERLIDQLEKKGEASVNVSIGRMQISIIEEDYINLLEQAKEMENQQRGYSEEEVLQIIKNAFNQGERYGWDTQFSIGNIDEMKSKIPFISLEKYLETFNK